MKPLLLPNEQWCSGHSRPLPVAEFSRPQMRYCRLCHAKYMRQYRASKRAQREAQDTELTQYRNERMALKLDLIVRKHAG